MSSASKISSSHPDSRLFSYDCLSKIISIHAFHILFHTTRFQTLTFSCIAANAGHQDPDRGSATSSREAHSAGTQSEVVAQILSQESSSHANNADDNTSTVQAAKDFVQSTKPDAVLEEIGRYIGSKQEGYNVIPAGPPIKKSRWP